MHVAIVTAGGAGMFCGSCMHDNTWAGSLRKERCDVTLIPMYTPIRVDEEDQSRHQVFFGGINVWLEHNLPFWNKLPRAFARPLDAPWLINLLSRFAVSTNAKKLGSLAVDILAGESGPHRREVDELATFLARDLAPDVICFSNAMLVGPVRMLRRQFAGPIFCLLQGDDVFLEDLPEPFRSRAMEAIRQRAVDFDGFLVHSAYYRDFMSSYLDLPIDRFHLVPLGINLEGHSQEPARHSRSASNGDRLTVGYFARICPEKGLHHLVAAFRDVHAEFPQTRLRVGGYLGKRDAAYFRDIRRNNGDLGDAFEYIGSPASHRDKVEFLQSLDVLSVPTVYREPKGLYVLEAMANGIPVVQPRHGAFPEIVETTGGGLLVSPDDSADLARGLRDLLCNQQLRQQLGSAGHAGVRRGYNLKTMAERSLEIFGRTLEPASPA
jgi:glycosyltransferase involved in cell wall biosynthesis